MTKHTAADKKAVKEITKTVSKEITRQVKEAMDAKDCKGLEEAADDHIRMVVGAAGHPGWDWTTQDIADAFIAGAKYKEEQMMKEAICGNAYPDDKEIWCNLDKFPELKEGDKVRIIVLPKED